jgi:hypothetical protein
MTSNRSLAMTDPSGTAHRPPLAAILAVPLVVAVVLALFAWPAARLEPRDLPIGVVGAATLEQRLEAQGGAFDVRRYASEARAREAIADREVYGAFLAVGPAPRLLIASAASPAVAQLMRGAAAEGVPAAGGADPRPLPVEDVVEASPRANALASSVLPLVIAGTMTGALASLIAAGRLGRRVALVVAGSVLAGLVAALIADSWLDVVEGSWLANAGALTLTILAIASIVAGLEALLGRVGILAGVLTMILVGNPFSAVGSAPEMLPEPAGALGRLLPPGAGGNLLRSTGFFDGAAAGGHVVVLAAWVAAGAALALLAGLRLRSTRRVAYA